MLSITFSVAVDRFTIYVSYNLAALPGNRLEALKGDHAGQFLIRINDQWRICFRWPEGSPGPIDVGIVDDH
jgi:proteic killer suppression protein